MSTLRHRVLSVFKSLHKTRLGVFEGDVKALTAGRQKINEDFRSNKSVADEEEIQRLIKMAEDVELILRTSVSQAVAVDNEKQNYKLNVRKEALSDNAKSKVTTSD